MPNKRKYFLVNYYKIVRHLVIIVTRILFVGVKLDKLLYDIMVPYNLNILSPFMSAKFLRIPWVFNIYKRGCMPSTMLAKKALLWWKKALFKR